MEVELTVARVGEKSVRYDFAVRSGEVVAATGNLVIALAAPDSPRAIAWPDDVREALTRGGPQVAETYA